ncbi:hypothetical protein GCM10011371_31830 [Novosphingobium marinum]|uniref:histidine kinase n=2 Tax=Novosphingobium marinum TaxID=1514948 RepID=A0A7Y9XYI8_9SPHN|nr:sensor histidine kinase [Novosphingobium marinum]NYH96957.1 two-component sensor histidine kinase [Novosphingobium marinum]GGC42057.1 hypothetical protein GCM10011371_31830 [Novosphingobium marinum]
MALLALVLGWGFGLTFFKRIHDDFAAMVPSTAVSFALLGFGLLAWLRAGSAGARSLLAGAASLVAVVAIAELVALSAGVRQGIDAFLWPQLLERPDDSMAVATATSFLLAAACCLCLSLRRTPGWVFLGSSTLGLALCSVALVAYALDTEALYGVFLFTAMALHTAAAFAALFLAIMLASPRSGWIWHFFGDEQGSRGARRLLPFVVGGPFLLSVAFFAATEQGLFSPNFRLSVMSIAMMVIGLAAILRNATLENRAERRLRQANADLEVALADRSLLLREVYHRVKNNLQQINALLMIERNKLEDESAKAAFQAMAGRVQALGMVHKLLIQSPQPSEVDMQTFLEKLGSSFSTGHGLRARNIELAVEARPDTVHLDVAMAIGLLANELVANAIKHAFPEGHGGTISIRYGDGDGDGEGETKVLTISDDGVGYPAEGMVAGTGSRIVQGLVSQLKGTMTVTNGRGTTVSTQFPATLSENTRYV